MSAPLCPELEQKAQELAARIQTRAADTLLEMARLLVATTDDTLFGDTEFALRDQALSLVADAYAEHLPQKVATKGRASIARTVRVPLPSTALATRPSRDSAERSVAGGPTTTAASAEKASVLGMPESA